MLFYRARLDADVAEVLSASVRRRAPAPVLGGRAAGARSSVRIRWATPDGRVLSHRGSLTTLALPEGRPLLLAGWQVDGRELLLSFRPGPPPGQAGGRGAALTDQFRLPFGLRAWGTTAVREAELDLQAVARGRAGSVTVAGAVTVTLNTGGASYPLRIPFCRLLAVPEAAEGLRWQALAGVTGLHLKVAPGGLISGELVIALRCEGRPREGERQPADFPGGLRQIREVTGRIASVSAEPSGPGLAVAQGILELDLYWFDRRGRSRWTGRTLPFSALLPLEGLHETDRLEAEAIVERLSHRAEGEGAAVHALVAVTLTALRPTKVQLGGARYRMEQEVGAAQATVALEERLDHPQPQPQPEPWPHDPPRPRRREIALPLPGPAAGWEEVAAVLAAPEAATAPAPGGWRVRAALGGTPAGEPPYPAPLRAAAQLGPAPSAVAGLTGLGSGGLKLSASLGWGPPLPEPAPPVPAGAVTVELDLPGAVRSVWALGIDRHRIQALLLLPNGQLYRTTAPHRQTAPLKAATAFPTLNDGHWRLRVTLELTDTRT